MKNSQLFLLLAMAMCINSGVNATSWRVNNNPAVNAHFSSFQDAVTGASAGDTLYIEGSLTSYGTQSFGKKLIIIGPGYFLNQNDSTQAVNLNAIFDNLTIDTGADGSMVSGIYVNNQAIINAGNVIFSRNNVSLYGTSKILLAKTNSINNCAIIQNYCQTISTDNTKAVLSCMICNNIVLNVITCNTYSSVVIFNNVVRMQVDVYNSVIKNNIHYYLNGGGFMLNTGNVFQCNITAKATPPAGTGNIGGVTSENVFIDYAGTLGYSNDGKWQLKTDSPAIGAGEGGTDCGAFGGLTPYVLSGLPAVPHIFEAIVPTAGSSQSGLPVTIKVKGQN